MIPIKQRHARIRAKCQYFSGSSETSKACRGLFPQGFRYVMDKRSIPLDRSPPSTIKHEPSDSVQQNSKELYTRSKSIQFLLSSKLITDRLYLPSYQFIDTSRDAVVMLLIVIISQLLILSGDIETNPGPVASDKPSMNGLISLTKADGSYLRIIRWIASLSRSECVDFAHLLLIDQVTVRKHQQIADTDEFVRAVLEDWLSSGDDSRAVPRTWAALADCMEAAGLPGDLVKAIREACPSGTCMVAEVDKPPSKKMKSDHGFIENGPIQILVEPDIPRELLALMKEYADMLVVLEEAELCLFYTELRQLKSFLCSYCAFEDRSFPKGVINTLKEGLKIYIFNIDTLIACCEYFKSQDVSRRVQQYKEHLDKFFSTTSVKNLQEALQTKITSFDNVEHITLKLNETVSNDTLENLNKLVHHIFGYHGKALIMHKVCPGCICITWIAPSILVPILKTRAARFSVEYLASNGVLELMIADYRIVTNEAHTRSPSPVITVQPRSQAPFIPAPAPPPSVGSRIIAFFTSCAGSRRRQRRSYNIPDVRYSPPAPSVRHPSPSLHVFQYPYPSPNLLFQLSPPLSLTDSMDESFQDITEELDDALKLAGAMGAMEAMEAI